MTPVPTQTTLKASDDYEDEGYEDAKRYLIALNDARGHAWSMNRAWFSISIPCNPASRLATLMENQAYVAGLVTGLIEEMQTNVILKMCKSSLLPPAKAEPPVLVIAVARGWFAQRAAYRFLKTYRYEPNDCRYTNTGPSINLLTDLLKAH